MPNDYEEHDIAMPLPSEPASPPAYAELYRTDPDRYWYEVWAAAGVRQPPYKPRHRDELLAGGLVLRRAPTDPEEWVATAILRPWGERLPLPEPDPDPPNLETWIDHPDADILGLRPDRAGADGRPITLEQAAALPDPEWLVENLLIENELAVLYGDPKAGKTFAAIDLALCVATGTPFHGLAVGPARPVLYVIAEGNAKLFARRCEAWKRKQGIGRTRNFRFIAARIPMGDRAKVRERLTAHLLPGTALVVIDTLTRNLDGDENSPADMAAFVAGCDDVREGTGTAVLALHHQGKTAGRGPMGHTRLLAAVDTCMKMSAEKSGIRKLEVEQQRNGPGDMEMAFRIVDGPTLECVRAGKDETDAEFLDFAAVATADHGTRIRRLAMRMDGRPRGKLEQTVAAALGLTSGATARRRVDEAIPVGESNAVEFEGARLWLERLSGRSTVVRAVKTRAAAGED
jgi:hypothetical protein